LTLAKFLKSHFDRRHLQNSRYSLRAFARDLDVSPGKLSEIFSGKIVVGPKIVNKICDRLKLDENERMMVMKSHLIERSNSRKKGSFQAILAEDQYAVIAQPEHYAILSLLETRNFKSNPEWIAQRLGLPRPRIEEALRRLIDVGLLTWPASGPMKLTRPGVTSSEEIPSKVIRDSHRVVIEQAIDSLENISLNQRDITSITIAVNASRMQEAKEMIRKFRLRFSNAMQKGTKTEVYTLNVQFFPNTILPDKK
jgi:uncharacterized protein (TIGR02147 family)